MEPLLPLIETFWWIRPEQLAGVRKPLVQEISQLQAMGIGAIVSVMDDPSNLDLYQQSDLPYLWLPTRGGTAPSPDQVQTLADFIDQHNQQGIGVAVHCSSGRRRTGTLLAAYLILKGASFESAMKSLLAAKPDVDLREAQTQFLETFARQFSPQ